MHQDPSNLFAAVKKATGREMSIRKPSDRQIMQNCCYILNVWGYDPQYDYRYYIRGPYSIELADDYHDLGRFAGEETSVPDKAVADLRSILDGGRRYVEAYSTVLLVIQNNPGVDPNRILRRSLEIRSDMEQEVRAAYDALIS